MIPLIDADCKLISQTWHVVLECEKYDRDRMEMMCVILTEMGREMNEVIERTGREWMVVLVGLCGEVSTRIIDVK